MSKLSRWFPFLDWPRPDAALLRGEIGAALTVAVIMIPQSVAYAGLAGMPLVTGLYATFLPALAAVLILQIAFYPEHTLEWVLAMLGAALFLFIPMLISPAAMGMGDVKLAALLGAALGKSVGAALFAGLLAGGAYGLVVFAREGLAARRKAIAFGPFLALGGLVVFFLGGH